jgi:hypothetical protein
LGIRLQKTIVSSCPDAAPPDLEIAGTGEYIFALVHNIAIFDPLRENPQHSLQLFPIVLFYAPNLMDPLRGKSLMRYLLPTVITYAAAYTGDVRPSFASSGEVSGAVCGMDWNGSNPSQLAIQAIQISNNHRDINKFIRRT